MYYGDFPEDHANVKIPFNTFSSDDPSASVTITNLVAGDVKIHKDGAVGEKASSDGVVVSIDFDGITGNHIVAIDTSNDTGAAGFWVTGKEYQVRIEGATVDGATINAFIGSFSIERAGGTIALLKLIQAAVITNAAGTDVAADIIAVKAQTVAIEADTDVIDDGTSGLVKIAGDVAAILVDTAVIGALGAGLTAITDKTDNIPASPAPASEYDTEMARITGNVALASVLGALNDAASDGDPTTTDTLMKYIKQLINILIGTAGIVAFPAEAGPANAVSLAEVIRAIHVDVTGLNGSAMIGTNGANTTVPDAAGVAPTAVENRQEMDSNSTQLAAILSKLLKYIQLLARSDAAIETDNATELTAINADGGSGAGNFSAQTDAVEALRDLIAALNNLSSANVTAAVPTVSEIQTEMEENGASILDTIRDDLVDGGRLDLLIDAIKAQTDLVTAARMGALTDWIDGGRLDLLLDAIKAVTDVETGVKAAVNALNNLSAANVNTEVADVLKTDTLTEPAQGAPGVNISMEAKIALIYKFMRNKITDDGTDIKVFNDAGAVVDHKAPVAEVAGTVTRGEFVTGP